MKRMSPERINREIMNGSPQNVIFVDGYDCPTETLEDGDCKGVVLQFEGSTTVIHIEVAYLEDLLERINKEKAWRRAE